MSDSLTPIMTSGNVVDLLEAAESALDRAEMALGLSVVRVGQSGLFRSFTVGRQAVNDTSIRGNGRVRSTGASNTSGLPLQTDAGADGADNSIGDTPNLADLVVLSNWSLNWLWIRLGSAGKIFILACDKFITTVTSAEPSPHKLREVPE